MPIGNTINLPALPQVTPFSLSASLINLSSYKTKAKINYYHTKTLFINEELFKKYRIYCPSTFPEKSLLKTHPLIAK
jgi:hypothetical protein